MKVRHKIYSRLRASGLRFKHLFIIWMNRSLFSRGSLQFWSRLQDHSISPKCSSVLLDYLIMRILRKSHATHLCYRPRRRRMMRSLKLSQDSPSCKRSRNPKRWESVQICLTVTGCRRKIMEISWSYKFQLFCEIVHSHSLRRKCSSSQF